MLTVLGVTISTTATPEADVVAAPLRNLFDPLLTELIGIHEFRSSLASIVVFPQIIDQRRGKVPAKVTYKRGSNAVFTSVDIPHDEFMRSDSAGRINFFAAAVQASLEQIQEKYLPTEDLSYLCGKVEAVRVELLRREGLTSEAIVEHWRATQNETVTNESTQIVLQWLDHAPPPTDPAEHHEQKKLLLTAGALEDQDVYAMEETLQALSDGLFEVDGHDLGAGTLNIFIYTQHPVLAVRRVVEVYESGRLRRGLRIGIESEEPDRRFRPVFPPELTEFDFIPTQ